MAHPCIRTSTRTNPGVWEREDIRIQLQPRTRPGSAPTARSGRSADSADTDSRLTLTPFYNVARSPAPPVPFPRLGLLRSPMHHPATPPSSRQSPAWRTGCDSGRRPAPPQLRHRPPSTTSPSANSHDRLASPVPSQSRCRIPARDGSCIERLRTPGTRMQLAARGSHGRRNTKTLSCDKTHRLDRWHRVAPAAQRFFVITASRRSCCSWSE